MSADQKKTETRKPETSAAGEKAALYWQQFKQGKLISYRVMAIILVVVAAVGLWLYIRSEKKVGASKVWYDLESANSESALKEFADSHPDTMAAKVARLHLARNLLGPEGIDKLAEAKDQAARDKAVENIQKAQESFKQLAEQSAKDPVIHAECYLGLAKAEAALIGVTKPGSSDFIGSFDETIKWLDKLAEAAEGTPWGEQAKKLAASLKTEPGKSNPTRDELTSVQTQIYRLGSTSTPPGGPFSPGGSPFGGLPPIPGITGGPTAPSIPQVTPAPPGAGPPVGVGTVPIPPAVSPLVPGQQPSTPVTPAPAPILPPPPTKPTKK